MGLARVAPLWREAGRAPHLPGCGVRRLPARRATRRCSPTKAQASKAEASTGSS